MSWNKMPIGLSVGEPCENWIKTQKGIQHGSLMLAKQCANRITINQLVDTTSGGVFSYVGVYYLDLAGKNYYIFMTHINVYVYVYMFI